MNNFGSSRLDILIYTLITAESQVNSGGATKQKSIFSKIWFLQFRTACYAGFLGIICYYFVITTLEEPKDLMIIYPLMLKTAIINY